MRRNQNGRCKPGRMFGLWALLLLCSVSANSQDWELGGNSVGTGDVLGTTNSADLRIITGGTEQMRVDTDGQLGIGLTAPQAPLHLYRQGYSDPEFPLYTSILLEARRSNFPTQEGRWSLRASASDVFSIGQHDFVSGLDYTRLTINSAGNVGIGPVNPRVLLHVAGGNEATLAGPADGALMIGAPGNANLVMDENEIMARNNGQTATLNVQPDGGRFVVHGEMPNSSSKFVVREDGRVGIGTLSPGVNNKLEVHGNVAASGSISTLTDLNALGSVNVQFDLNAERNLNIKGDIQGQANNDIFGIHANQSYTDGGYIRMYGPNHATQSGRLSFVAGEGNGGIFFLHKTGTNSWDEHLSIRKNGIVTVNQRLGVGTSSPAFALDVAGTMRACTVRVNLDGGWCDYVFADDYDLMPIEKVAEFIEQHQHLPNIPPAVQVEAEGINVADMTKRMMEKIEEMTLYMIDLNAENRELRSELNQLRAHIVSPAAHQGAKQ